MKFSPSFRLVLFLLALPVFGLAQQFPVNNQKIVQGVGTTAQGISSYSSSPPTTNPSASTWRHVTSLHMDTVLQVQYIYKRPRWYPISVVRRATPPPATASSGSTTIDYSESIWQSTADSLTYYYEEENGCWQPIGTYLSSTTPVDVAATGSTGAICYGYGLWYDPDVDSIYAQQGATWTAIGSGASGAVDSIVVLQDSIIVGYGAGVEVTRDTIGYPAGISLPIAISDVTGLADSLAAAPSGTGTNQRIVVWTGTNSQGNSTQLQSAAGVALDAALAYQIIGGSTAARPTGAKGMFYTNTDNNSINFYDGTNWRVPVFGASTTGLGTAGRVFFADASGLASGSANLFWDITNSRLGLGTASPNQQLELTGNMRFVATSGGSPMGIIYKGTSLFIHDFNIGNNGTVTVNGFNTFVGVNAGNLTMGTTATIVAHASSNTAVGNGAFKANTTGYENTAVGLNALDANTTGLGNNAFGIDALGLNTSGVRNVAMGRYALNFNSSGGDNVGVGGGALYRNTSGGFNTGVGSDALFGNTTASNNVGIGLAAGAYLTNGSTENATGANSVFIGANTRASAAGETNQNVFGYAAIGRGSNTTTIGNSSVTSTKAFGTFEVGTLSGTATQLGGWTSGNIATAVTLGAGLSFSSGTLNGAFLPLTLTGTTEVNTAGQVLRIRDAGAYPDVYMNSNYWTAASDVNTFIDVGSTSGQMQLNSAGRTIIAAATNVELQSGITGEMRFDGDSLVLEGVYPVGTASDSVLVRDASNNRVKLVAQSDMEGVWLKTVLESGNNVDVFAVDQPAFEISDLAGFNILNATDINLEGGNIIELTTNNLTLVGNYPVGSSTDSVLVRDGATGRVNLRAQSDLGTWLKPELEAGNNVSITGDEANELGIFGLRYLGLGVEKGGGDTQRAFIEMSSDDGAGTFGGDTILGSFYGGTYSDVVSAMYLLKSGTTRIKGETEIYLDSPNAETAGAVQVGDITNGDGVTLAAYNSSNVLTSVTIDGTGNSGLLFDDGALTLSNNLSEVADTTTRTLGTGQQIYSNGYSAYLGSGFSYSSGRITNASGATRLCKIRYYFTAETAGLLTDALTIRVMIWDGATYTEHRAGRLTMTLNDDWELTGSKETIITLPDGDGVNIAFDSADGLDVSNFGYVIEKI